MVHEGGKIGMKLKKDANISKRVHKKYQSPARWPSTLRSTCFRVNTQKLVRISMDALKMFTPLKKSSLIFSNTKRAISFSTLMICMS